MSKIIRIFAENFMAHKNNEAVFDESNILNFCGKNASGKTAFTMIPEILGYNAYKNEQSKYIKDNTNHYCIGIEFDDGITISQTRFRRAKSGNGRVLWKAEKDGKILYQNMLNDSILNVDDVPDDSTFSIKKYMNMVIDEATGEQLNVRRRNNKLLFIDTTGGDNYKIFNSILGCEQIRKASQLLSEQLNNYSSSLKSQKIKLETLSNMKEEIKIIPKEELTTLEKLQNETSLYTERCQSLEDMQNQLVEIQNITVNPELQTADLNQLIRLEQMYELLSDIINFKIFPQISYADTEKLCRLEEMRKTADEISACIQPHADTINTQQLDMLNKLQEQKNIIEYQKSNIPNEVLSVDTQKYKALSELMIYLNEYKKSVQHFICIQNENKKVQQQLKETAEKTGYKICSNCGAVVI